MPSAPQILPTKILEGTATGLQYRLEGELVPVLHMALDGSNPVYFEHHVLLWKYPSLQIGLHPLRKGLVRRAFAGMPLLLLQVEFLHHHLGVELVIALEHLEIVESVIQHVRVGGKATLGPLGRLHSGRPRLLNR